MAGRLFFKCARLRGVWVAAFSKHVANWLAIWRGRRQAVAAQVFAQDRPLGQFHLEICMTFKTLAAAAVICAAVAAPALAEDLTFTLINNSSVNLNELYVSAHEADTWGDDILGTDVLAAGEQLSLIHI
jgi:hypothetical protein